MDDHVASYLLRKGKIPVVENALGPRHRSVLADRLLYMFGWGHLSANSIQWIAEAAVMDGMKDETLVSLAGAGAGGRYKANVRRDMLRSLRRDSTMPDLPEASIPVLDKNKEVCYVVQKLMNPLSLLESVHRHHRAFLTRRLSATYLRFGGALRKMTHAWFLHWLLAWGRMKIGDLNIFLVACMAAAHSSPKRTRIRCCVFSYRP